MWEDFKQLVSEFDVDALVRPAGPEQFLLSLIIMGILAFVGFVAIKMLLNLVR